MAGRHPKVTPHDRAKEGMTIAKKESIERNTPAYASQEFTPPPTLNEKELEVWNWLTKIFRETTNCMVSDADIHLMELYCQAKVAAEEAHEELQRDPRAYILVVLGKDKNGKAKTTAKPNPNLKKWKDNATLCLKFFDQLGLSPLARARAGYKAANAEEEESIWEKMLSRTDDDDGDERK